MITECSKKGKFLVQTEFWKYEQPRDSFTFGTEISIQTKTINWNFVIFVCPIQQNNKTIPYYWIYTIQLSFIKQRKEQETIPTQIPKSTSLFWIMGSLSNCRFYENQFPAIDELVVVQVRQIAEMGAYVKLLEYDNIEGMILLSELSRRRIRSINKLIRVGRNEVVVVLRVDQEKGIVL